MMSASNCLVLQEKGVVGRGEGQGKGLDVGLARELTASGPRLASWLPGTLGRRESEGVCEENATPEGDPVMQEALRSLNIPCSSTSVSSACGASHKVSFFEFLADVRTGSSVRPFPTQASSLVLNAPDTRLPVGGSGCVSPLARPRCRPWVARRS